MSKNLANERMREAAIKRLHKANKYAKQIAHGGFGQKAKEEYLTKYPEAKEK